MKNYIHADHITLSFFFKWEVFHLQIIEKIKTHILYSTTFFFFFGKSCCLWDNVKNYCRAGETTKNIMAHAYCMLGNPGYISTQGKYYLLLTHCNDGWKNGSQCYVINSLPVLSPLTAVFPCQYHSDHTPYLFIKSPPTICYFNNWQTYSTEYLTFMDPCIIV